MYYDECFFFFQAEDGIRDIGVTGVQTCALPIFTPDKDYGQLIRPNVYMYRPQHGGGYETLGPDEVQAKYGIPISTQVIDLLALMGDSADNFPGCPGVGEKTAAKLINEFGSVEELLAHTDKLKGKMREKVEAAVEDIKMSKFLATIRTDVPLTVTLDDLKITEPDKDKLAEIFAELEFKSLTNKILNKPEQKQKNANLELDFFAENADDEPIVSKNANFSTLKTTPHYYQLIDTEAQMREICDFFLTNEILSLDTETTSTNAIEAELVGLSFSVEIGRASCRERV